MPENRWPVRIAVNVMRARLTVIGFNIAIVSFQIVQLYRTSGGLKVPGIDHVVHVGASMSLYMALALSLIALVAFIMSSAYDEVGVCTHWSLLAGDLLMYLGLAHTLAGFFAPLAEAIEVFSANLPGLASEISILKTAALITGGTAWFLAVYAGPVVSLVRSPFQRRINITLGMVYLMVLLTLSWISAHAARLDAAVTGKESGMIFGVLGELVQPFRW
jgi:hypothetical protein